MTFRTILFFICFTLGFMFYPGTNPYIRILAFHREILKNLPSPAPLRLRTIPVVDTSQSFPLVTAQGVYIVEADTLTPVYGRAEHERFFPASTAKIMTALVTHDLYRDDEVVKVSIGSIEGQLMGLVPGEQISVENLLYGLLVHSGNDAAYALANASGFSRFVSLMNAKAAEIGMKESRFSNPAGLDEPEQLTTPFDLAVAARELLSQPTLKRMVGTKEIIISDVDYTRFHKLTNVNKLLGEIQGLGGLKTGYTEAAGENLVSFYRYKGHDFIIVVMKSEDRFADTVTLVNWIKDRVKFVPALE